MLQKLDSKTKNKRLINNTLLLYARMIIVMIITLYTTRLILNLLGVEDYGIYNVVAGFVALFGVLNKCLTTSTNRFYNFSLGKNDLEGVTKVFNASLRIQLLLIIILIIVLELIGLWYISNKMVIPQERLQTTQFIFQCSIISLLFLVLQTPYSSAVLAHEKMNFYALVSVIDAFLKLSIALSLKYLSGDRLWVYGLLMLFISAINFLLYLFYCKFNFKEIKLSKKIEPQLFRSLLSFSIWSILDPFSYIFRDQGSNMTLNLFFGPVINAAYGIAAQISAAVANFSSNLSVAFRPQIIQSYSCGDYTRTKNLMVMMSKSNYILQFTIALPLLFELPFILTLWLGNYPQYTVIFSVFIVLIHTFNALNEPISIVMVSTGKIKLIKSVSAVIICSVVPIGYLCLKNSFPAYSVYSVMSITTILNQISCVVIMSKVFKEMTIKEYLKRIAWPCLIYTFFSLIPSIIVYATLPSSWYRFIIIVAVSIISSSFNALMFCLNKHEREVLLVPLINYKNKFLRK